MKQLKVWGWLVFEAIIGVTIVHFQELDLVWAPVIVATLQVAGKELNKVITKKLNL